MAAASEPKALIDGELYVIVKEAINLQACDSNGLSDPFVVLRLVDEVRSFATAMPMSIISICALDLCSPPGPLFCPTLLSSSAFLPPSLRSATHTRTHTPVSAAFVHRPCARNARHGCCPSVGRRGWLLSLCATAAHTRNTR